MIKKISHISFALLLIVATTGMTISEHFCGSDLISIELNSTPESCCDDNSDCCHNESFTFEIEDEFSISSYTFEFAQYAVELTTFVELLQIDVPEVNSSKLFPFIPPPPKIQTVLSSLQTYLI